MLGDAGHWRGVRQDGVRGEQSEEEEDDEDEEEEVDAALSWRLGLHRLFLQKKMGRGFNAHRPFTLTLITTTHHRGAVVRPLVRGPLALAVTVTAAGTRAVGRSQSFHPSAGLTDVKLLQTVSGKPQGRFHLEEQR